MLETLKRTSLSEVKVGDPINLERAMSAATRYGGHVVQGHVDGVGEFVSREKSENWDWVKIRVPRELLKYVVMKGSIPPAFAKASTNSGVARTRATSRRRR